MAHLSDPGWQYLRQTAEKALADQQKKYDSKKNVWIADAEEGFIAAEIKSSKGDMVTVVTSKNEEKTLKKDEAQQMNPPKYEKTEDMANLTFLNESSVLHNLRQRYFAMMIYTYSGLFCVVINPYKRLPIYTESVVKMFMGKRRNEMPPHLFAAADEAYRNMMQDHENQSMLITGESGAGKTENTKKVISYFAIVGAAQAAQSKKVVAVKGGTLEEQIVQTNPVLEAFGNAKTVRNNNSSRFGKFIRIHFSPTGKLAGGDIEHYLLEKSRVIKQAPGERCYHIFYQIMSGQIKGLREKLQLNQELKYYHFVSQAELTIDGVDDKEEMKLTDEAFDIMGFEQQEKDDLFRLCSAIMHMGEMKFKQRPREEQAEAEDVAEADLACKMYGSSAEDFVKALLKPRVKVGTEWVNKGQNLEQVNWAVGGLAKALYARMFHWLIKRCNKTLDASDLERKYFIGVLDIAGFEIFDFNSFEQLWINFVNEKLQQFFNHHMFVLEQEEYQREGIQWEFIDFGLDLQACIELIEKPLGIISMLDEECIVPKASDMTFVQKLNDQHLGKHPNFQKPKPPKGKQAEAHFALVHYAGTVRYNVTAWLEKNKDPLNDTAVSVLKASKDNKLLLDIWDDYKTQEDLAKMGSEGGGKKKGKSSSFMTVSMLYRESLNNLMSMLRTTHPHFIRCIIPNELKKSAVIDAALVLNQLTCNGVLEGIRICRKGFPNRLMYPDFKQRYAILAADEAMDKDVKKGSEKMLARMQKDGKLKEDEYRVGHTKVFFKAGILARLEEFRDETLSRIISKFQSTCRWWLAKHEAHKRMEQRAGMLILQRNIRAWCTLRTWKWFQIYGAVKPLLSQARQGEEMEKMEQKLKEFEESFAKEEKLRKELEEKNVKMLQEKNDLFQQLQHERDAVGESEQRSSKLLSQKTDLEKQISDINDRLADQEDRNSQLQKSKKKVEQEAESLKKSMQDLEMNIRKQETEKQTKDHQIRSLQDEITQQDELISKINKEKKQQEDINRKLTEDLQAEEDKVNHLNKLKSKLEHSLDEAEDALEREKRVRQDIEKARRKVEGDLKIAQENIEELNKQKHDIEANLKKKEADMHALSSRLEDEQSLVSRLQKQIKELQARIQELEEEMEAERQSRSKAEKARSDLQRELEELSERLDEAGGATQAQLEMNKKREAEMSKLRRDIEESNMNHEAQLGSLRKKHNDAVAEMGEQLEHLQKIKVKLEKDKVLLQREVEDAQATADAESKQKINSDKLAKQLELQVAELQSKCDEQARQLADYHNLKGRMQGESSDLLRQLEEAESQINSLNRLKTQLQSQVEESKRNFDEEVRERQAMASQLRNYQHEVDTLRDHLEEEGEAKTELQRLLSKTNAEVQQWRAKYESEGLSKAEELEEARRKLQIRLQEMQEHVEGANQKIASLEKVRQRLSGELEDAQVEADRANSFAQSLEKKQKGFDKVVDEWKRKVDDLHAELDATQRENRNLSTEIFKLKNVIDEHHEQTEGLRRENKCLAQEMKDLTDQLGEGGKSVHELQKIRRRLELEKEELQVALDEAEAALEAEESKVLRAQVEISQIRQEIEKRIQEKEDEFENTRKNHQRALDSMQASLEAESKGRAELMRMKKKLESDINELEIALDHANKANSDAQKNLKRYQDQIKELQATLEEEQRARDDLREHYNVAERRCALLQSEKDELGMTLEQAEKSRRQAEMDAHEAKEQSNDLHMQLASSHATKRKVEGDLQQLKSEMDEALNELKANDERSKKAMIDAARLADELRQEQEHSQHVERMRKGLELQIKEMQARLDEAEQAALKGGKKIIQKLEQKIRELETEYDAESRRHQEADKNYRRAERRVRELVFQVDEDKKNHERLHDLVDKLQSKLKTYKRQVEDAEQVASANLAKYRQIQHQLEDAEERADVAENSLAKLRARNRTGGPVAAQSAAALSHSASAAAASRGGAMKSRSAAHVNED